MDKFALAVEHVVFEHSYVVSKCGGEADAAVTIQLSICKLPLFDEVSVLVYDAGDAGLARWVFLE